ncbi:MAG: 23S rRNA (uracil(1939)-C(5))-methyltransferase RlmD [Culicoidibacterales bacterium]
MDKQHRIDTTKTYKLIVSDYTSEGLSVMKVADYPVFVTGLLLGEEAEIQITKANKNYGFGEVVERLSDSPNRIAPECGIFPQCGGCQIQHMNMDEEKIFKTEKVRHQLQKIAKITDLPLTYHEPTSPWGYRNKLIVPLMRQEGKVVAGFYAKKSHDLIPFPKSQCLIQDDMMMELLSDILAVISKTEITLYNEKKHTGELRNIYLRKSEKLNQCLLTFIIAHKPTKIMLEIAEQLKTHPRITGIIFNVNLTRNNNLLGTKEIHVSGKERLETEILGTTYEIASQAFYQVNHTEMERLYTKVLEHVKSVNPTGICDLYCGSGTITLQLAKLGVPVVGIEIVKSAIADAKHNAQLNKIFNTKFIEADATTGFAKLKQEKRPIDTIVVDPPRKGLESALISEISAQDNIKTVVYVSCDSGTLARDLYQFQQEGWNVKSCDLFNLFPRTTHVESVVMMER